MKTILVVDDEEMIRELYRVEMEEAGYRVALACTGEEALSQLEAAKPDLVVLDIRMPGMNGIDLLRRIKATTPRLPVVLNTAYSDYRQDFSTWASDAYVVKSSDLSELKTTIQRLLQT